MRNALGILVAAALLGCDAKRPPGAREQFALAIEALKDGSLERAYSLSMPLSYDRDLNRLIARAKGLLDDEDLKALRGAVEKAAAKARAVLAARAGAAPGLAEAAAGLVELPRALGLESPVELRRLDVLGMLRALDAAFFRRLAGTESLRSTLSGVEVRLEAEGGEWAKLRFGAPAGAADVVEVVSHEGKWVPVGWVASWPEQMASLDAWVGGLEKRKEEDPEAFRRDLRAWTGALDDVAAFLEPLLKKLGPGASAPGP